MAVRANRDTDLTRRSAGLRADLLAPVALLGRLDDPASGTALGAGVTLFHDARDPAMGVLARDGGLKLTVYQFDGSYLSMAMNLPAELRAALGPGWRLVAELEAETTRRLTAFLRLNVAAGGQTTALHEVLVLSEGPRRIAFGLDAIDGSAVDGCWMDLILSRPRMAEVRLTGLTVTLEAA